MGNHIYTVKNKDFSEWDNNTKIHLVKVDKNDTHYYVDTRCPKCGGTGFIHGYEHVDGGRCFKCGGSGRGSSKITVRTEEYQKKLDEKTHDKLKKQAPEYNKTQLNSAGFSDDGVMWLVMGDTYPIKDTLKAAGAHYSKLFGWHFDKEPEIKVPTVKISAYIPYETDVLDDYQAICTLDEDNRIIWAYDAVIAEILDHIKYNYIEDTSSYSYFGEVGAKFNAEVTFSKSSFYDTEYGTTFVYSFTDTENHIFVWKTQKCLDVEVGKLIHLCGTIKAHKTYRGIHQTEITRCKIKVMCI